MAGGIYGSDQVRLVNQAYPALLAHLRSLFDKDRTPFGVMRIHFLVEYLDTTELSNIFMRLAFLSPAEKRALVRAAVYEVLMDPKGVAVAPEIVAEAPKPVADAPQTFTPPRFTLNANPASAFHGQAPADTPPPMPVVTSTHTPKVAEQVKQGEQAKQAEQSRLDAAVDKVRKTPAKDVR